VSVDNREAGTGPSTDGPHSSRIANERYRRSKTALACPVRAAGFDHTGCWSCRGIAALIESSSGSVRTLGACSNAAGPRRACYGADKAPAIVGAMVTERAGEVNR